MLDELNLFQMALSFDIIKLCVATTSLRLQIYITQQKGVEKVLYHSIETKCMQHSVFWRWCIIISTVARILYDFPKKRKNIWHLIYFVNIVGVWNPNSTLQLCIFLLTNTIFFDRWIIILIEVLEWTVCSLSVCIIL